MATKPDPPIEPFSVKTDASITRAQELSIELRTLRNGEDNHPDKWGRMVDRFENLCASVDFLLERYIVEP